MTDAAVREGPEVGGDNSSDSSNDELSELRDLLLAPEQTQLSDLQERIDNPVRYAADVSRVLHNAVTLSLNRDNKLSTALMPTVESAIGVSVKKKKQRRVDVSFSLLGPGFRRAFSIA